MTSTSLTSETGLQLYARLSDGDFLSMENRFFPTPLNAGEICEICFQENAPVQEVIIDLLVTALQNGQSINIVFLDTCGQLSLLRLLFRLEGLSTNSSQATVRSEASCSLSQQLNNSNATVLLKRFHYLKCFEAHKFTHAIEHAANLLLTIQSPCLFFVDSLTAFHGLDCDVHQDSRSSWQLHTNNITAIRSLVNDFRHKVVAFVTQLAVLRKPPINLNKFGSPEKCYDASAFFSVLPQFGGSTRRLTVQYDYAREVGNIETHSPDDVYEAEFSQNFYLSNEGLVLT